ncbi:hypothetical protein ACEPAG_3991 [Sanghuangporus baumii]
MQNIISTVHDNDPDTLEREKRKNLSGKQHKTSSPHEHAPGWNEYLASASEAAVKADGDRSDGGPEGLQKKTTEHIRARYEADEDDSTDGNTQAGQEFQKETVRGPLGSAKGNVAKPKSRSGGVAGGKP